jgi:hypothetical protein
LSSAADQHASYSWKNVVISFWFGPSTLDALATRDAKLEALCALHPQGISTIDVVLPGKFALPSPEVREELSRFVQKYAPHVVASALILLGSGFWASAVRGAVTAVTMLSRREQKPQIFGAPRAAADWLAPVHLERTGVAFDAEELAKLIASGERVHAQKS